MIDGVIISQIGKNEDGRGWLSELYRKDVDHFDAAMCYASFTKYNILRGPHEHKFQSDFFVFIGPGDFELHLWDNRACAKTYKEYIKIVVGESNKVSVFVPVGIVHGYKCISNEGGFSINLPDRLYCGEGKKEPVDEIRHEEAQHSPFRIE